MNIRHDGDSSTDKNEDLDTDFDADDAAQEIRAEEA